MALIALAVLPFAVSLLVCALMIRLGPKDAPDGGRKTQAAPVPSSGGVGVMAGIAAAAAAGSFIGMPFPEWLGTPPLAGLAAFAVFAGLLGWADDVRALPAGLKLVLLLGAAAAAVMIGPQVTTLWIAGSGYSIPLVLGLVGAAAFIFVMANAVNFMDGANGIAMGTAMIILLMLAVILAPDAVYSAGVRLPGMLMALLIAAAAALAGFLVWNLQGKLFAGDAGSLSVGGLIGGASALFAVNGPVLVPLTLCLPVLVDVLMTLAWRARNGRPLMQAHRDHAYQLLLRAGWRHGQVARLWWGMTALCGLAVLAGPFAAATGIFGKPSMPLDVIVFSVLLVLGAGLWMRQRMTIGRRLEASVQ